MRKINTEKSVVFTLIILRFFDFHSTLTFMGYYGVYGKIREGNWLFWSFYNNVLQNHVVAIALLVILTTPIPLIQIYLSRVLDIDDRVFYFHIFLTSYILTPMKNYLVCFYEILWIKTFVGIISVIGSVFASFCFFSAFLFVIVGLYQRREVIKTYLSKK